MAALSARLRRLAGFVAAAALLIATDRMSPGRIAGAAAEDPRRIISLVPATTEMLFAMGAGDRLAGVSSYDRFPPEVERLPRVGGLLDPDVERILSLKPDLVIVYDTQTDFKRQLERAQVPIFSYVHRGLPDITETMRALGVRIGAKAAADQAAARIEQQLDAIARRVAGLQRPKTLLVFGREQGTLRRVTASGGYGFLHDVLVLAGGADALGDLSRQSVDMSTEMILMRAPEVIIELHYGDSVKPEIFDAERRVWNALASVPAVKTQRVYLLDGLEFVVPGPRIVIAAERIARTLHPEAFE
ncbi:MAG: ABC transporter substrate-binding protein [Acidobacteria bacterium]|nr:ABC transporter substrate-binding protein [Acidobacteriota bacterium]